MRLVFEDDSDFSGSESSVEEGNESTATVNLASTLPPRRLKPTVRIQTPVSLTSLYRFFWMLSEAVLSVVCSQTVNFLSFM